MLAKVLKILGLIYLTWFFIIIPIVICIWLYAYFNQIDLQSEADELNLVIRFFNELKDELPFYELYSDIFIHKIGFKHLTLEYFAHNSLKCFFDYGLFQLLRHTIAKQFYAAKSDGKIGKAIRKGVELGAVYSTWLVLFSYLQVILTSILDKINIPIVYVIVTFCFLVIAVVRFAYTADVKMVVAIPWTIFDGYIFEILKNGIIIGCGTWVVQIYHYENYWQWLAVLFTFAAAMIVYDYLSHLVLRWIAALGLRKKA